MIQVFKELTDFLFYRFEIKRSEKDRAHSLFSSKRRNRMLHQITYDNIKKIATDQGYDNANGCLLGCPYFKENFKLIAIDLSKQQAINDDPKVMRQEVKLIIWKI